MVFSRESKHPCGAIVRQNNTSWRGKHTIYWLLPISCLSFYQYLSHVMLIFLHLKFVSPVSSWQPCWEDRISMGLVSWALLLKSLLLLPWMWAETTSSIRGNDLGCVWLSCQEGVGLSTKGESDTGSKWQGRVIPTAVLLQIEYSLVPTYVLVHVQGMKNFSQEKSVQHCTWYFEKYKMGWALYQSGSSREMTNQIYTDREKEFNF